jgi:hypothetical protein
MRVHREGGRQENGRLDDPEACQQCAEHPYEDGHFADNNGLRLRNRWQMRGSPVNSPRRCITQINLIGQAAYHAYLSNMAVHKDYARSSGRRDCGS